MANLICNPTKSMKIVTKSEQLTQWREHINAILPHYLPAISQEPKRLHQAMHYAVCNGGKRLRTLLAYAAYYALNSQLTSNAVDTVACAVELVHAYSLIHDDLPPMDDDALRRGQPTCHIAFDEATAILAGDALQSRAFEILAELHEKNVSAEMIVQLVKILAQAIGSNGMAGGQAIDLAAIGQQLDQTALEQMHAYKTGALITASIQMAALLSPTHTIEQLQHLTQFGQLIGLAFQIRDDILDAEGDAQTMGKATQKDLAKTKPTFTSMLGVEPSKRLLQNTYEQALSHLAPFGDKGVYLQQIAQIIITRDN